jgi:hypothetical protein
MKTLKDLTDDVLMTFNRYNDQGTNPWDYETATYDLAYQIGMLTKRIMQMKNKRYADGLSQAELKELVADECADILANTLFVAHELDIDLEKAWQGMLDSDEKKIEERT